MTHTGSLEGQEAAIGEAASIWIIEDNEFFRENITELINKSDGFRCTRSYGLCEDALDALRSDDPPDVILIDLGLPGMSGVEGIRRLKGLTPSTHIVVVTVHDDDANLLNALAAGATGYLLKNAPPERILDAVEEALHGGAPMNAHIAKRVLTLFTQHISPSTDYALTGREKEILHLLVDGYTQRRIAGTLFLSHHTVGNHIRNIYSKLHVNSRSAAVAKALKERL